jgi:hypothetical protein
MSIEHTLFNADFLLGVFRLFILVNGFVAERRLWFVQWDQHKVLGFAF